jgi:hypothetical protein
LKLGGEGRRTTTKLLLSTLLACLLSIASTIIQPKIPKKKKKS